MRFYILYDENGDISETADAGFEFEFDEETIKFLNPNKKVAEINEENYQKTQKNLEYFRYIKGEIIKKSDAEIVQIENQKKDWAQENTLNGLKERIKQLEIKSKK